MAAPLLTRIGRGLRWAFFGRPARRGIGPLTRPRRLYVEATVTSPNAVRSSLDEPVAWARLDLVEHVYGILGRVGVELEELRHGSSERAVDYHLLRTIVRGGSLALETAHGEPLTLREGSFTSSPRQLRARAMRHLPPEVDAWPGRDPDLRLLKEACLRRGDVVRFEALFTPERHPRAGSSYRDDVELRYRVDGERELIDVQLAAPEER